MEVPCPSCIQLIDIDKSIICKNCGWLYFGFTKAIPLDIYNHFDSKKNIYLNLLEESSYIKKKIEEIGKTIQTYVNEKIESDKLHEELTQKLLGLENQLNSEKKSILELEKENELIEKNKALENELQRFREISFINRPFEFVKRRSEIKFSLTNGILEIVLPTIGFDVPEILVGFSNIKEIFVFQEAELIVSLKKSKSFLNNHNIQAYEKLNEFNHYEYYIVNFLVPNDNLFLKQY